jgi:hypothetical protein
MIFSLESNGQAQTKGSPPVITSSYAQERIRGGEEWRVYISASDPDGDMSKIYCVIDQPGAALESRCDSAEKGNGRKILWIPLSSNKFPI